MAIAGGVLGFVLILALTLTTSRVIDAAIHLDLDVIAFLGRFARRSRVVDTFIWTVWTNAALQGGVVMVLVWGVWFSCGEAPAGRRKRETMLSSLIGMYACLLLTLVFRVILPFRARPAMDQAVAFQMPYLPDGMIHVPEATSFPSGHAAVLFSLAIGLWLVSRTLGLLAALHGFVIVCLPRLYFGRHYATDILAGAVLAIATVLVVNELLRRGSLVQRLRVWSETRPGAFYSLFFLCSLDIATDFAYAKTVLRLVGSVHITRVVMSVIGVVAPA